MLSSQVPGSYSPEFIRITVKKMKSIKVVFVAAVAAGLVLGGCSLSKQQEDKSKQPIKIGVSACLSGEAASYGEAFAGGAELAAKEINDAGGVNGQQLKLILEDDKCNPADGVTVFQKLINIDGVTAIVGPLSSAAAGSAVSVAQSASVPVILAGATAPDLTQGRDYIFRNIPSDSLQGRFTADFIYSQLGKKKVALLYVLNAYGSAIQAVFEKRYKELGGEVVYSEGVMQDARDLRTQLLKAKSAEPEALYLPLYPQSGLVALGQIKEIGWDVPIIGGEPFSGQDFLDLPAASGVMATQPKSNNPADFQQRVKEVTGRSANLYTPFAYDAVKILASVMKKVGTDRKAIRDELAKTVYRDSIAVPVVEFDEQGDLKSAEFEVKVIKDGGLVDYKE